MAGHGGPSAVAQRLGWDMKQKAKKPRGWWDDIENIRFEVCCRPSLPSSWEKKLFSPAAGRTAILSAWSARKLVVSSLSGPFAQCTMPACPLLHTAACCCIAMHAELITDAPEIAFALEVLHNRAQTGLQLAPER